MAIVFTGSNYTTLRNNLGAGEGNWPNGNLGVREGDIMLFWMMLPADDMEILSDPDTLTLLMIRNGGRFRMYWKIADAEDAAHIAPQRYEFLIGPEYTGGNTYREMPVVQCSWSGVDSLIPLGNYEVYDDTDVAPPLQGAKAGDTLVTFHALVFHREDAGSFTPITPPGMFYRINGWGDFPIDGSPYPTTDWHLTIYDKPIMEDGDTDPQEAALNAISHGLSGAILLNGSATAPDISRKSIRPPGDKYSYYKPFPT